VKELSIYLFTEAVPTATEILRKHGIGGLAFYEIYGAGRTRRHEIPELVFRGARAYQTGRRITPEFEKRSKIETFVPDSSAKEIVDELISCSAQTLSREVWCLLKRFLRPTRSGRNRAVRQF
jgi:nitrogen regulatory protein P-II 1